MDFKNFERFIYLRQGDLVDSLPPVPTIKASHILPKARMVALVTTAVKRFVDPFLWTVSVDGLLRTSFRKIDI
jgi:hypothetical protein